MRQALSFCDYSLAIKAGVHYTLCGGEHVLAGMADGLRTKSSVGSLPVAFLRGLQAVSTVARAAGMQYHVAAPCREVCCRHNNGLRRCCQPSTR